LTETNCISAEVTTLENDKIKLEMTPSGQIAGLGNKTTGRGFIHTDKSVRVEIRPNELKVLIVK
jgi:hypothetical protein